MTVSTSSKGLNVAARVAALSVVAAAMLLPAWMILVLSFSTEAEIVTPPPELLPQHLDFANYQKAWEFLDLGHALINSLIVATIATVFNVAFSAMAGYAFARIWFPYRDALFVLFLVTTMMPVQLIMVPLYLLLSHVPFAGGNDMWGDGGSGLLNSYAGLVFPFLVKAVDVFLFRQYFRTLPRELGEQARIDGCSEIGVFRRIYLPLAKPVLVTVGLLSFIVAWNQFAWPLISTSEESMYTAQVALFSYKGYLYREWSVLMAANIMTFIIPVALYLLFQRHIVRGIAVGGVKG